MFWLSQVAIPVTPSLDPLKMLTDDADIAAWQNEGLPADRMSAENATILTNCERWPLMVDPQLQGIKWIKAKHGEDLRVTRIGQKGWAGMINQNRKKIMDVFNSSLISGYHIWRM